jgi:hypothetical protein
MSADVSETVALAKFGGLDAGAGEYFHRLDWSNRQIAARNEGPLRSEQADVSLFSHRRCPFSIYADPATAVHDGEELGFVRRWKADRLRTPG